MEATIVIDSGSLHISATEVKTEDGFIKFKNPSLNGGNIEQEAWIPVSACRCITWKDKPWETKKEDKKE